MTLAEMAAHVCGKVNQQEPNDVTACKSYVRVNHEIVWNDALWKDSLYAYEYTLNSTGYTADKSWMPLKQILLVRPELQKVVAVRTSERKLNVQSPMLFYRVDWNAFNNSGAMVDFEVLSKCVWEFDTGSEQSFISHLLSAGDAATPYTLEYVGSNGMTIFPISSTLPLSDFAVTAGSASRLNSFGSQSKNVFLTTVDQLSLGDGMGIYTNGAHVAAAGVAPKRERIHLFGSIPNGTGLRVLGKRVVPRLVEDTDEPGLSCADPLLLLLAQADMLERERQYGKAQAVKAEAVALLGQLKAVETVQQAHNVRFIPEDGYGNNDMWNQGASPLSF